MSSGQFVRVRYAADYGAGTAIHPIRVQEETEELVINSVTNDPPTAASTNPISASVSSGKRRNGLIPRTVTLRAPLTGQPTGYVPGGLITLPLLNKDIAQEAQVADNDTSVSYLGISAWTVAGYSPERVN